MHVEWQDIHTDREPLFQDLGVPPFSLFSRSSPINILTIKVYVYIYFSGCHLRSTEPRAAPRRSHWAGCLGSGRGSSRWGRPPAPPPPSWPSILKYICRLRETVQSLCRHFVLQKTGCRLAAAAAASCSVKKEARRCAALSTWTGQARRCGATIQYLHNNTTDWTLLDSIYLPCSTNAGIFEIYFVIFFI